MKTLKTHKDFLLILNRVDPYKNSLTKDRISFLVNALDFFFTIPPTLDFLLQQNDFFFTVDNIQLSVSYYFIVKFHSAVCIFLNCSSMYSGTEFYIKSHMMIDVILMLDSIFIWEMVHSAILCKTENLLFLFLYF